MFASRSKQSSFVYLCMLNNHVQFLQTADGTSAKKKKRPRYEICDSSDSEEEGSASDSDVAFISGAESSEDDEFKHDISGCSKKKKKKAIPDSEADVIVESSESNCAESDHSLKASEIRTKALESEKLKELFEEGIQKFQLNLKGVIFDHEEVDSDTFQEVQDMTWAEAMKKAQNDKRKAKILIRENQEDNKIRKAAKEAWKKKQIYRGRYAKVLRDNHYSFNNPTEKNCVDMTARTLSEHYYTHSLEPLSAFGKPPAGKEWPVKRKRKDPSVEQDHRTKKAKKTLDGEPNTSDDELSSNEPLKEASI